MLYFEVDRGTSHDAQQIATAQDILFQFLPLEIIQAVTMSTPDTTYSIRSEINKTLSISTPLVSAQLVYASSGFLGTAMVAHLGQDALAASVLVSMIWMSLSVMFFGILNAVSVLVSHQYGAKNYPVISNIMGQSFLVGVVIALMINTVMFTIPYFISFSGQPKHVLDLARTYTYSLMWQIPALILLVIIEQFLAGVNRAKLVLRISLMVVPIEIPLIYILVFGKLGMPACGIAGIGYAFAITYTLTLITLILYLTKSRQYKQFGIFSRIYAWNWHYIREIISIGIPMGFMYLIEVCAFAVVTFWIGRFGTTMLAGHQIVFQFFSFAITLVFAMSQAVTVRVGHSVGEEDRTAVQYASYAGMLINFFVVIFISSAFYFAPGLLLSLDMDVHAQKNIELFNDASSLLSIAAVLLIFDNFRIIGFGALRGLKDTRFPMYASMIAFWVIGLTAGYLFGFLYHFGANGVWWGMTLGIAVGALIVLTRLHYLLRHVDLSKIKRIPETGGQQELPPGV